MRTVPALRRTLFLDFSTPVHVPSGPMTRKAITNSVTRMTVETARACQRLCLRERPRQQVVLGKRVRRAIRRPGVAVDRTEQLVEHQREVALVTRAKRRRDLDLESVRR